MFIDEERFFEERTYIEEDSESSHTYYLPVYSEEFFIGTLHLTNKDENKTGYLEWCVGPVSRGDGFKITLQELIDFIESKEAED